MSMIQKISDRNHSFAWVTQSLASLVFLLPCVSLQGQESWIDLDGQTERQSTVCRTPRRYHGHPTTVLLADGKTILCVHPQGHGKGPIILQRSEDGGRTWSLPLPVPENWSTSQETPTIHRLVDPGSGKERLVLFSGLYPIRSSVSEDDGVSWTPLAPIGEFGGIVAMGSVTRLLDGSYAAYFHDDGRYFRPEGTRSQFSVYQTLSRDGGLTWGVPKIVWSGAGMDLCEPGVVRSPDGRRLAMLLRENSRRKPSQIIFSSDESANWSDPQPLPAVLTGDRHVAAYSGDGRLVVSFRDMADGSPTRGDWVAWIGEFADLESGKSGQYRIRLSRNYHAWDCGYPGVEVLPDGTVVMVSYGHWEPGDAPFVRAVRLHPDDLATLAPVSKAEIARPPGTIRPTERLEPWWHKRVAEDLAMIAAVDAKLVFLGDSITQSWREEGKQVWKEVWEPMGAVNLGVSGDKTQNVLWRLDHGVLASLGREGKKVRSVVLMIGTNNSNGSENTAEEIAQGIVAIVKRLRRALPQARVLLLAIFPRDEKPSPQREKCSLASSRARYLLREDDHVYYLDIGDYFVDGQGAIAKEVMPDALHLSPAAYRTWSQAIMQQVQDLLR
jgi:lysophospholipase L1-like esterase